MANWQPIEAAPKGSYKEVAIGKGSVRVHFEPDYILVPTSDGKVTISYWVPGQERWCMFTKKHPPKWWMPLPEPPVE